MPLPPSDLLLFPTHTHTPPHTSTSIFSPDFHSVRTSLNPTWSPNGKSSSTYSTPPRFWLCRQLSALWGEAPQATVQLLQTEAAPPSLTVAHTVRRKRMLMDQIRWKLRWEHGAWRRGGEEGEGVARHCWSAVIQTQAQCAWSGLFVVLVWVGGKHWPPRIAPPVTDMFSLQSALKFMRWREGVREGGTSKDER